MTWFQIRMTPEMAGSLLLGMLDLPEGMTYIALRPDTESIGDFYLVLFDHPDAPTGPGGRMLTLDPVFARHEDGTVSIHSWSSGSDPVPSQDLGEDHGGSGKNPSLVEGSE